MMISFVHLRRCCAMLLVAAITLGAPFATAWAAEKTKKPPATFENDILPIFKSRCWGCHSGSKPKAGLDLSTRRSLLRGSRSGAVVRKAAAEFSRLWGRIASGEMPPKGPPLTPEQKGLIRTWINSGAVGAGPDQETSDRSATVSEISEEDRSFWSFQIPRRAALPQLEAADRLANPIDSFLSKKLAEQGLRFSPAADRHTLIRRVCYDLLGLPPSPEQVQRFVSSTDPDAYRRLVDRLLASPHYGERWGRHWLDLAGYADSAGILNEDRALPLAYRYRDYVIRALNADKPYDRFLQEQIAGDELTGYWQHFETSQQLPDEVIEALTATGFLRCAADSSRPDFANIKNADALYFYPTINDTIQIVATSTLGLTLQCARCHDHMFDPIPQEDFYRVQAIFMGALRPSQWIPQMERRVKVATKAELESAKAQNDEIDARVKLLQRQTGELKQQFKARLFEDRLGELPQTLRKQVREAFSTAADDRTEQQRELVRRHRAELHPDDKQLTELLPKVFPPYKERLDQLNLQITVEQRGKIELDEIRALYDLPGEVTTPFLRRGDALTPGHLVSPGTLSVLKHIATFQWQRPDSEARSTGRRLAFARWLTNPEHPLTARVLVNRLWLQHFGEGIVATPGDFGRAGAAPSHPALLDWLAREFVESGWSVKQIHRLILTSTAYRQSSRFDATVHQRAMELDPENRLLWRQRMRRLEAESLRDTVYCVAGILNRRMFGTAIPMQRHASGEVTEAQGHDPHRRSVYLQIRRLTPLTMLQNFDQPNMETNCIRRSRSTVSTQALTLLNSNTMVGSAEAFADRVLAGSPRETITRAVWLAYSRRPSESECRVLEEFVGSQTARHLDAMRPPADAGEALRDPLSGSVKTADTRLALHRAVADLCHMLLSANEFIYID